MEEYRIHTTAQAQMTVADRLRPKPSSPSTLIRRVKVVPQLSPQAKADSENNIVYIKVRVTGHFCPTEKFEPRQNIESSTGSFICLMESAVDE